MTDQRILDKSKLCITYLNDLFKFWFDCCGYKDIEHPAYHELAQKLTSRDKRFKIFLLPRYTFKSSLITVGYGLWRLAKNRNLRILIYSDSASKAQNFLTGLKNQIYGKAPKAEFRNIFGHWEADPRKGKWNESQIEIKVRDEGYSEPSVDTGGIETSKVGMHYDLIFFDDIVSDINTTTKDQMDKIHECYQKSLSLLTPKGEVVIVGTRWHFGDLYGRLLEDNRETHTFEEMIKDAEDTNPDGTLLFESVGLDKDFLAQQRKRQGTYIYSCLYRNNPVDDETATFKVTDFKFYGRLEEAKNPAKTGLYSNLYITGTIDPAGQGDDFTSITVVGTDRALRMHVLEVVNLHMQTNEMVKKILDLNQKYHFKKFGVETVFFRGQLKKALELAIQEERVHDYFNVFAVDELKTRWRKGEGKHQRIEALQPFHERGDLLFPGDSFEQMNGVWRDLGFQMIQYPSAPHDDILDSLSWHVQLIQRGGTPKKAGPKKNSPAWLEQQWIQKHHESQRRIPRQYRKLYIPSLQ